MNNLRRLLLFGLAGSMVTGKSTWALNHFPLPGRPQPEEPTWVEFDIGRQLFMIVRARIRGVEVTALIDTGTTRSILNETTADRLGISRHEAFNARGLTSGIAGAYANISRLEIGQFALLDLELAVVDLAVMETVLGHPIDLIIGQELFEAGIVEIDFPKQRLRIWPPGSTTERFGNPTPLQRTADGHFSMPLTLPDLPPLQATIDLGSNIPLCISPRYAKQNKVLNGLLTSTTASAGAEGITVNVVSTLRSVDFGGARLSKVPIEVPKSWDFASDAIVGLPILNRFSLVLDVAGSRAWLQAISDRFAQPFSKDRSGLSTRSAGERLLIVHVSPGSPAEKAGLKANDEIVAVDGVRISKSWLSSRPRIGHRPPGTAVAIELASGKKFRMLLQDYF